MKFPLQPHPDPALDRHWRTVQIGVLLLPFSVLIGGVTILLPSLAIWRRYANQLVQQMVNQGLLLLGGWMVIIALFADRKDYSLPGLFNFLPFFIVFIAQSRLITTPAHLRRLAWLIVLPSIPVIVLGLGQLFLAWRFHYRVLTFGESDGIILDWAVVRFGRPEGRMSSLFYYATILASYFVTTFTLSLGLWLETLRWPSRRSAAIATLPDSVQWATIPDYATDDFALTKPNPWARLLPFGLFALTLLNGLALVLTNSRNAWGIALVVAVVFAIYHGWRWIVAAVAIVVTAVLESAYGPAPLKQWFRTVVPRWIWARINDDLFLNRPVASLRTSQWKFAWHLVEQRPLTGWGLRNFTPLYNAEMHFYIGHPHNVPLMLMAEMGIPATLIFYGMIGWVMYRGVMWVREVRFGVDAADRAITVTFLTTFFACTLFSFFDVTFFDARINTLNWLVLAAIWGVGQMPIGRRSTPSVANPKT